GAVRPDTAFAPGDFREGYFKGDRKTEVWSHVQAIAEDLGIPVDGVADAALRFSVSPAAVSTVIAGMRSVRNVERNVSSVERGPLDEGTLRRLRGHRWERNFYSG